MKNFKIGDKFFAYNTYTGVEQVTITRLHEEHTTYVEVHWDETYGNSSISKENLFVTKEEAIDYAKKIDELNTKKMYEKFNTKEELIDGLFSTYVSENHCSFLESEALKTRIDEFFNIKLN